MVATAIRSGRSRWPKNSWNRSTTGCVLAENADGARRSAITRLRTARATNDAAEQEEHQQLRTQHRGEDAGPADRVEPQVVGVEAGEETAEQQHSDEDHRDGDEGDTTLVGESPGLIGEAERGGRSLGFRTLARLAGC